MQVDKATPKPKPVEALTGRFGRVSMDVGVLDNLDTCTPAQLVSVSSGLRKELDGLYKVRTNRSTQQKLKNKQEHTAEARTSSHVK